MAWPLPRERRVSQDRDCHSTWKMSLEPHPSLHSHCPDPVEAAISVASQMASQPLPFPDQTTVLLTPFCDSHSSWPQSLLQPHPSPLSFRDPARLDWFSVHSCCVHAVPCAWSTLHAESYELLRPLLPAALSQKAPGRPPLG